MISRPFSLAVYGSSLVTGVNSRGWCEEFVGHVRSLTSREIVLHNLGARGANSSAWGVPKIATVANQRPDAAIIEFINDAYRDTPPTPSPVDGPSLAQSEQNFRDMADAILDKNSACALFFMTMNPVISVSAPYFPGVLEYYQMYRDLASELGLGLIDNTPDWGSPTTAEIPDGLHPLIAPVRSIVFPNVLAAISPLF